MLPYFLLLRAWIPSFPFVSVLGSHGLRDLVEVSLRVYIYIYTYIHNIYSIAVYKMVYQTLFALSIGTFSLSVSIYF